MKKNRIIICGTGFMSAGKRAVAVKHPALQWNLRTNISMALMLVLFILLWGCGQEETQSQKKSYGESVAHAKDTHGPATGAGPYDKVHPCDEFAAHPNDPDRMARGVAMNDIVPRLSLRNCQQAVKDHPGTPRFYYQLGRAYEASRRPKEALENYQKADAAGYRMAAFNLGLAYANGRGAPVDAARAEQYFRKANDAGVDAKEALAQFVFTTEGYSDPKFFAAVYNGELKGANPGQVSPYLTEFLAMYRNADANAADCRSVVSGYAYAKIAEHAQMNVLGRMLGGMASAKHRHAPGDFSGAAKAGYETGRAFKLSLALQVDKAHADAQMFYDRHGCDSPVAKRFFHNVEAYCTSLGSASLQKELKRNYTR